MAHAVQLLRLFGHPLNLVAQLLRLVVFALLLHNSTLPLQQRHLRRKVHGALAEFLHLGNALINSRLIVGEGLCRL